MSSETVPVGRMAEAIMEGLTEFAELATDEMKAAVRKSAKTVKDEIGSGAPVRTGKYAKSWRTKTTKESANALVITVYSPSRYMLVYLLENGHAKRGGGRVKAIPHIAPAEQHGVDMLEREIERALQ